MNKKELKEEIIDFLKNLGAFKIGIADPDTKFHRAIVGCHPKDIMSNCHSVIVYAFNIGLDYYMALDYEHNNIRLGHLYRDWTALQLITFLRKTGYDATAVSREYADEKNRIARMSFKLAAYEAGIGVFGRPSIIIMPEYGPRVNLGVVLTDAVLEPDGRMKGFNPCEGCNVCTEVCPINAIRNDMPPPKGFDRKECINFVNWLKEKTSGELRLCGCCFNVCPTGKVVRKTLEVKKWQTLDDLTTKSKKKLANEFMKK